MSRIIPIFENHKWSTREFNSDDDFKQFLESIFKEPGEYNFDSTAWLFNEEAKRFNSEGNYCNKPFRSKDFTAYWEDQKNKCRTGVIYKKGKKVWICKSKRCTIPYGII